MFRSGTNINWNFIAAAVSYYKDNGYLYTEVPWIVSEKATKATFAGNTSNSSGGCIVGSAEQSFIQMMLDGEIEGGKLVACTPCFRDEKVDNIHHPYFLKVELIQPYSELDDCIQCAKELFESLGEKVEVIKTDEGYDINLNGIEIGSYGVRRAYGHTWVYGTGLAEPRFSTAMSMGIIKHN